MHLLSHLLPILLWLLILSLFLLASSPEARTGRSLLLLPLLCLPLVSGCTTAPTKDEIAALTNACAIDAGIRPTVTALLAIPGLATPAEETAITAARAVIDPICANPAGTPEANALAALTNANLQIVAIVTTLQARKAK